jgi:hypothetical protein
MASKKISERVSHELTIGMIQLGSADGRRQHVSCTYPDGSLIAGPDPEAQPHPALRVSASDQDDIIWSSRLPFWVDFEGAPTGIFFRPLPWKSVRGRDGLHRVHSGPVNPQATSFVKKDGLELKFIVRKRKHEESDEEDPDVCALDPHIIVEP